MDDQAQANNEQHWQVIERRDLTGAPMYFSLQVGLDYGQPAGGWTADKDKADVFSSDAAQDMLKGSLAPFEPFCQVVPK